MGGRTGRHNRDRAGISANETSGEHQRLDREYRENNPKGGNSRTTECPFFQGGLGGEGMKLATQEQELSQDPRPRDFGKHLALINLTEGDRYVRDVNPLATLVLVHETIRAISRDDI